MSQILEPEWRKLNEIEAIYVQTYITLDADYNLMHVHWWLIHFDYSNNYPEFYLWVNSREHVLIHPDHILIRMIVNYSAELLEGLI